MSRFARHFFVCVNERPAGCKPSCGARGAGAVLATLQAALALDPVACADASVTAAGCLGPCTEGPAVVVYPEGTWYAGVSVADAEELADSHLVGGQPVARLVYKWPAP